MRKQQREEILKVLEETYKDTKTALNYNSPFELLVAVIMSAQCTDERVNKITARIFPKYNTPEKMGALTQEELENEIRDCGLFRAKAKNLLATCHMLVQEYNSTVPDTIEKLMTLPGGQCNSKHYLQCAGHCRRYACFPCFAPAGACKGCRSACNRKRTAKGNTHGKMERCPSLAYLARPQNLQSAQTTVQRMYADRAVPL